MHPCSPRSVLKAFSLFFLVFLSFGVSRRGWRGGFWFPALGVCHGSFRFRFRSRRSALRAGRGPSLRPSRLGGAGVLGFVLFLGGAGLPFRSGPVSGRGRPARAGLRGQGVLAVRRVSGRGPRSAPAAGLSRRGVRPWLGLLVSWRWRARARCRRRPPRWSWPCAARWWPRGVRWSSGAASALMPPSLAARRLRLGAASLSRGFRVYALSALADLAPVQPRRFPPWRHSRPPAVRWRGGRGARLRCLCLRVSPRALARWWRGPRRGAWCSSVRPARAARCWQPVPRFRVTCRCSPSRSGFRARPCRRSTRVCGCRSAVVACGLRPGFGFPPKLMFLIRKWAVKCLTKICINV